MSSGTYFLLSFVFFPSRCLNMGIDSPWSCCGDSPDRKWVVCLYLGGVEQFSRVQGVTWNLSSLLIFCKLFYMWALAAPVPGFRVLQGGPRCRTATSLDLVASEQFHGSKVRGLLLAGGRAVRDLPHVLCVKKENNSFHLQNRKIFPLLLVANWITNWLLTLKSFSHFTLRVTSFPTLSLHKFTILFQESSFLIPPDTRCLAGTLVPGTTLILEFRTNI